MEKEVWEVVESSEFQRAVSNYLTDFERGALHHHLAREPLAGTALEQAPWLWQLQLGKLRPVTVLYAISIERRRVYLVDIGEGAQAQVEPDVLDQLAELSKDIAKGGVKFVFGRALWELIKDLFS